MTPEQRIRKLLTDKERQAQEAWGASEQAAEITRIAARVAWVRETSGALREAQREMDHRCTEACERLSEIRYIRDYRVAGLRKG